MIKDKDFITAVYSNFLFNNNPNPFKGFMSADRNDPEYVSDFENIILNHCEPMMHESAVKDDNYKEILACVFIVNPDTRRIAAYRNTVQSKKDIGSSISMWSCGYSGHVKSIGKAAKCISLKNPILETRCRDLSKEIIIPNGYLDFSNAKLLGYINNDFNEISKTHFVLVYGIITNASEIINRSAEYNEMITSDRLEKMIELSNNVGSDTDIYYYTKESFPSLYNFMQSFK